MYFRCVEKAYWEENPWDEFLNLINDFKLNYSLKVTAIDYLMKKKYVIGFDGCSISAQKNSQGLWITFESFENKQDFDEKYDFIFNKLRKKVNK